MSAPPSPLRPTGPSAALEVTSSPPILPTTEEDDRHSKSSSTLQADRATSESTFAIPTSSERHTPHDGSPSAHIAQPGPETRRNTSTNWPDGVLSGGKLIDMLECLSATADLDDWAIALWLQDHYITPFARVERLDGLIVSSPTYLAMINHAHERYIELVGERARVQRLWVPGLEPTYAFGGKIPRHAFPEVPSNYQQKNWVGSEMYYKNGVEVPRKGVLVEHRNDEMNWERKIWMAPWEKSMILPGLETLATAAEEKEVDNSTDAPPNRYQPWPPVLFQNSMGVDMDDSSQTLSAGEDDMEDV